MLQYLKTDIQTRFDLGIQETPNGEHPLPLLFLHTETKEGKRMMRNWITQPLSDLSAIQARQEAIAWEGLPVLPMDESELDFIEYYLEYRDQLSVKGAFISFFNKIDRFFKYDSTRYIITRGVGLCIRLLQQLDKLHKELPNNLPSLIQAWADQIRDAFYIKELKEALNMEEEELSDFIIDQYDYLFRQEHYNTLHNLLTGIYLLDVCRTARFIAQEGGYCCTPILHDSGGCSIQGFRHPFVKDAQKNDWNLTKGNIAIFTGSNMAGKSTTLKALVSTIWLAQCGLPVPADAMTTPIYDAIYTSINLPDSLRDGRSHFMAEVLRIKEVLMQARSGERCLIVLDEMFRGTNAQDAYEASVAVNQLLLEYPNCHFLISTHILEYAKYFEHHPACQFYYMESEIKDDRFICSYRLKEGISESKVGYWIVRKELKLQ